MMKHKNMQISIDTLWSPVLAYNGSIILPLGYSSLLASYIVMVLKTYCVCNRIFKYFSSLCGGMGKTGKAPDLAGEGLPVCSLVPNGHPSVPLILNTRKHHHGHRDTG